MADDSEARPAPPCTLVIFGVMGDLARRLLVAPAIYNLVADKLLPEKFALLGIARQPGDTDTMRQDVRDGLREFAPAAVGSDSWRWLEERLHYLRGDFEAPETYDALSKWLAKRGASTGVHNALFYLATPPNLFGPIVTRLGQAGLTREGEGWRRVIIEKPFGTDLKSAQALNRDVLSVLNESQTYRIDHYLGKETVQNIMVLRFANAIFEPLWNRDHIDHVQITAAETVGVEHRGRFYDPTGALRDMVPTHLFQLLTLIAMEPPTRLDADPMRYEKVKVLNAVQLASGDNTVRGQYGAGTVKKQAVAAYRDSPDVPKDSRTETYVALKLLIDSWRWAGVPFYLRTGKAMASRKTEIAVQFKRAPLALFRDQGIDHMRLECALALYSAL
jgi:glucose-6-phosphate 1-dehydrogenase